MKLILLLLGFLLVYLALTGKHMEFWQALMNPPASTPSAVREGGGH